MDTCSIIDFPPPRPQYSFPESCRTKKGMFLHAEMS